MAKKKIQNTKAKARVIHPKLNPQIRNDMPQIIPVKQALEWGIQNGLQDAIFGAMDNGGFGNPYGVQLSQVDTIFKNNRWYLISNMRQVLSQIYVEHGIIQTIVDVPVDDGLRGGVEIKSKQLSDDQISELQISVDQDDDLSTMGQALKWNRLYGGAALVILTDQDPETELDIDAIDKDTPLEFRAVDMWELFWDQQNTEGYDPTTQLHEYDFYSYYGKKLHKSRVMKMTGLTAPSFIRPRLRGWGFSVVEAFVRSLNQYFKANDLSFEVLDEFKLDIFKIDGLSQTLLTANGDAAVRKRVQLANMQKNYQNAITMDAKDDYVQKQLSFAGLAETMQGIKSHVASDLKMPQTKIFGQSAAGFSSGEDDIENYNSMVESQVRNKCKYDIIRVLKLKCQKLFGFVPEDLEITFKSLRILKQTDEEVVKTAVFNRVQAARQANYITDEEYRSAINKDNLLPIKLDLTGVILPEPDEAEDDGAVDETKDPGANKDKSRTPKIKENK